MRNEKTALISVKQALQKVLATAQDFGKEEISLQEATGRVLKTTVIADSDFPPFNRAAMDGIAIDFQQFKKGQTTFTIEAVQAAGSPQKTLQNRQNCIEVMTGAVLPVATDTVIRYEDIDLKNGQASLQVTAITAGQNIHTKGKDSCAGSFLIAENTKISAAEIGVLASVGQATITVAKQPRVLIISTGDELVPVSATPLPHQIRRSNVHTLVSLLASLHISSETAHMTDDKPLLKAAIEKALAMYDVLLFSGAVSKGKYDFLPEIFSELGVQKQFHTVAQRPGKPFWFGQRTNAKTAHITTVFGFPGNPISTYVNCLAYFYPWYRKSVGITAKQETAILTTTISFSPALTYFVAVKINTKNGELLATPVQGNGSGDLVSLTQADGFVILPATQDTFITGTVFPIIRFRK